MVMILFSWLVIGVLSLIFGKAIVDRVYHDDICVMGKPDVYVVAGIMFLNVYAQLFSIFYKVAGIACMVPVILGIFLAVGWKIGCIKSKKKMVSLGFLREHPYRIVAFLVAMGGTVVWTLLAPRHYDTGLYHAQAIRWIEEYGIVPGLGNLHMRLAYNSAFMSLQALFSLRWLGGQSLHTLNGFFCLFFLGYAIMTIRIQKEQGCEISDLLKCATVVYIVLNRDLISSPGTDLWTMILVLYICIKWCEFVEMRQESDVPWSFICLTGIYAVTVKLSAALIVLLVIYPLYLLIRAKNIKRICGNIVAAALILLPFLIRNVIISGYLVYPYAGIDLFHVDWKMRKDELEHDSLLIKVFGRGFGHAQEEYDDSVFHWIPHWFHAQETRYQVLIVAGTVCFIILVIQLFRYVKTKRIRESVFIITVVSQLIFWFMTAPLIRYGIVYLMIVIAVAIGGLYKRIKITCMDRLMDIGVALAMILLLGLYVWVGKLAAPFGAEHAYWVNQADYQSWPSTQYQVDHALIWVPNEGDRVGYSAFPAAPGEESLQGLHLRGESFKEGFYKERQE